MNNLAKVDSKTKEFALQFAEHCMKQLVTKESDTKSGFPEILITDIIKIKNILKKYK